MKKSFFFLFFFICNFSLLGQEEFKFETEVDKVSIPFKFINNLIFIPIKVNGIELNFLLDSGVEETILFSMEDKKEVNFFNVEKIALRGLGSNESIEGLKSTNNTLEIKGLKSINHLIYIVLDQKFNLSSHVGIPVNGIIGYHFFKNNLVEINYQKRKIYMYSKNEKNYVKIEKKFDKLPISIENAKPYINGTIELNHNNIPVKLLIDVGNSDAVWLFQNVPNKIEIPSKNFEDYLGQGFSGQVFGKRAMMAKFSIDRFHFINPIVAFPDSISTTNVKMVVNRSGSVGSEILKRFSVVFDYQNELIFLRKNNNFDAPFSYNKCGIEIQHDGHQWINETIRLENVPDRNAHYSNEKVFTNDFKYKLQLKPVYVISSVRKNSLAQKAGLKKEDILISINQMPAHEYSLNKLNKLLRPEEDRWMTFKVDRNGQLLTIKFLIQSEL
jgi:hypothetical protein